MTNRIAFIFALSCSILFALDTPKEIETPSQIVTDIQFDTEAFQQNKLIKKEMIETYKQARKAKSISKPADSPIYISNQKNGKALKKETPAKKVLGNEVHLEKRENAKQKLNELRAQAKAGNTPVIHDAMRKIKFDRQTSTRSRSRSTGTEFEFETIANLYEAFGYVLQTEGSECDGCPGNLNEMENVATFSIIREDEFEAWASDSGFTAFYFQFIDENETGEYDDGEIYAVSCEESESSNNMTVAYNGSVYDLDFVDFWMEAYDFDWDSNGEDYIDDFTYMSSLDGHDYYISDFGGDYQNGLDMCAAAGGNLVTITSQEEQDFVLEQLLEYGGGSNHLWLGLDDLDADGIYTWVTGEELIYDLLGDAEPGLAVEMESSGAWRATDPGDPQDYRRYMLEIESFDWTFLGEFDGHEYWLSGFESTWNDANNMFNDYYDEVHLVTISSQEENDFVQENVGDLSVWIGFTDEAEEGNWQWVTGEEVVYTNWNEGEPNNMNGEEHWAQMLNNGSWNDFQNDSLHFVVEVVDDTTGGGDAFIEGIVRDFNGNPIEGVDLWAENPEEGGNGATTDEGGYYRLELEIQGLYRVEVHGFGEYWDDLTMVEVPEFFGRQYDFMLGHQEETALIEIQTISEYNWDSVPYAELESPQSPQGMSVSDWDGWDFITVEAPIDTAEVFGWHPEFGDGYGYWGTEINPGDTYFVDVFFGDDTTGGDYGWIEGYVVDIVGPGIPNAEVQAWNNDHWYITYTDDNGNFSMEVPAGYYDMEAWAPGYSSEMNWVDVYPNEYSWVEFSLDQEDDYNTLVHGHVHDVDGNPLSFANVNASYLYDEWESEGTFTNEDGYYELYLRDDAYRITAGAEGFWVSAYDSIYVGGGDSLWLDFMLSPVGEFDGGWQGNVNLVGNYDPEMIFLGIMSEDYQVFRILYEPGPQEVELVNGSYHLIAGADGYQEVFIPNAINIENNVVNFDIHLIQEGLFLPPQIQFAGDVPNDQGRQMRLVWNPGVPGDWGYFEFFSIWRQVNEAPMILWDFIDVVPWHGMEAYSAVVPTLGDSTDMGIYWSTFRVTGHTENPNEFYDSEPVTGYSIDNLHPGAPGGVQSFTNGGDGVLLTWDSPMDEDFGFHRIYRHDTNSGDPAIEFTTVDTFYVDDVAEGNYEYWITAVDLNGNESDPSIIVTVTLAIYNALAVPIEFALQQNYPNPFNPSTQIQYALPTDANVSIAIYDLVGRKIRTLVNEQVTAGFHSTLWNATNDMGSPVSAGVYIYTITANDFRDVKKMILLK